MAQATSDGMRVVSGLCGARFADVHGHPHRSATLSDFWSRRWNRTAARWFRQHAFLPVRRSGVAVSLFALFFMSGIMHAYLVAAVVPLPWMVLLFFLIQPLLLLLERRIRVRRWRALAARTWTVGTLAVFLPLLLIPLGFSL
jgi:D-alanyl-lipoteichoic acid acyltransferase DltB (MBOAT superfamily)